MNSRDLSGIEDGVGDTGECGSDVYTHNEFAS